MPRSSALWTTFFVASKSVRPPKLLQPRPTTDTRRPDLPRFLCSIRSPARSVDKSSKNFLKRGQLTAIDRVGDEHRGIEPRGVPLAEAVAHLGGAPVECV